MPWQRAKPAAVAFAAASLLATALAGAALVGTSQAAPELTRTASHGEADQATGYGRRSIDGAKLWAPPADPAGEQQVRRLRAAGQGGLATGLSAMIHQPQAVWFGGGSPASARRGVTTVTKAAADKHEVAVVVAYDIPGRDCGMYSAGGARSDSAYRTWIDGFAQGIGKRQAVVIVEPDALPGLPSNCGTGGLAADEQRIADLRYAVERLERQPHAAVYLDAGNSDWQPVALMAERLAQAGVSAGQGFSLDVSNFAPTPSLERYGRMISECLAIAAAGEPASECPSQYEPPAEAKAWYAEHSADFNRDADLAHFVIDTSRNGQGEWTPPEQYLSTAQIWCNPPGRGVGLRPSTTTGVALVDAFLWIKTPGQSDGSCVRWGVGPADPARHMVDPASGAWFGQMATELVRNANPALP